MSRLAFSFSFSALDAVGCILSGRIAPRPEGLQSGRGLAAHCAVGDELVAVLALGALDDILQMIVRDALHPLVALDKADVGLEPDVVNDVLVGDRARLAVILAQIGAAK